MGERAEVESAAGDDDGRDVARDEFRSFSGDNFGEDGCAEIAVERGDAVEMVRREIEEFGFGLGGENGKPFVGLVRVGVDHFSMEMLSEKSGNAALSGCSSTGDEDGGS